MSVREKTIVAFMLLTVAGYGIYLLTDTNPAPKKIADTTTDLKSLNEFMVRVAGKVNAKDLGRSVYIFEKASRPWLTDPFAKTIGSEASVVNKKTDEKEDIPLTYSGFIQTPDKMLAVINGMEYEIGDVLENGYIVRDITTAMLVLETQEKKQLILQLEERL